MYNISYHTTTSRASWFHRHSSSRAIASVASSHLTTRLVVCLSICRASVSNSSIPPLSRQPSATQRSATNCHRSIDCSIPWLVTDRRKQRRPSGRKRRRLVARRIDRHKAVYETKTRQSRKSRSVSGMRQEHQRCCATMIGGKCCLICARGSRMVFRRS